MQWKALLERSELIVLFFESRERVEIFFFSEFFRVVGGWGLGFQEPVAY